jgi:hypothetical protein
MKSAYIDTLAEYTQKLILPTGISAGAKYSDENLNKILAANDVP